EAATLIQASCSLVVPYWYMWRIAHIAYMLAVAGAYGSSNADSGIGTVGWRGAVPVAMPSARGRPARVISAIEHLPRAIASAAWPTWSRIGRASCRERV